nr:structural maintenance of chromosomes protein 1 [Tanacetum cinerariifolium]
RLSADESETMESFLSLKEYIGGNGTADKQENNRDAYLSQTVEALRRLFPDVHGCMTELYRPTQKKYNLVVTIAMGRFMDNVVDNE